MSPVVLALVLIGAACTVAFWPRHGAPRRRPADRHPPSRGWARRVALELPVAFRRVSWGPAAGALSPTVHGDGRALDDGWRWRISTPGSVTVAEVEGKASAIASALNSRAHLVGALEVAPAGHEGWAYVSAWRADPLDREREIPWEPGEQPPCVEPGTVCLGVGRDSAHVHVPIVGRAGAMCMLSGGMRGSGKSEGMLGVVSQLVGWGWAPPVLIDTARQGMDLGVFAPVAAGPVVTTVKGATVAVRKARAECLRRAKILGGTYPPTRLLTEFDARVPLIPIVVDELQGPMGDPACKLELTRFAQETRAMGGLVFGATQYPTAEVVDATFRQQMAYRQAFRCMNSAEGPVILGSVPTGTGPHLLRGGPGLCLADLDGGSLVTLRTWRVPERWLVEHVRRVSRR